MTDELQLMHLAAIIENGERANADGYTRPVGYTSPIKAYTAPIGNLDAKKSAEEASLEAAMLAENAGNSGDDIPAARATAAAAQEEADDDAPVAVAEVLQPEAPKEEKQSLVDKIKGKPLFFGAVAAFIAYIIYAIVKARKG